MPARTLPSLLLVVLAVPLVRRAGVAGSAADVLPQDLLEDVPRIGIHVVSLGSGGGGGAGGGWVHLEETEGMRGVLEWEAYNLDIFFELPSHPCTAQQGSDFLLHLLVVRDGDVIVDKVALPRDVGPAARGSLHVEIIGGKHSLQMVLAGDRILSCEDLESPSCWHLCGIDHLRFLPDVVHDFDDKFDGKVHSGRVVVETYVEKPDPFLRPQMLSDFQSEIAELHAHLRSHGARLGPDLGRRGEEASAAATQYSSHSCVGLEAEKDFDGENYFGGAPVHDGMCLFRNICLLKGRGFTYLQHPRARRLGVPRLMTVGRRWSDYYGFADPPRAQAVNNESAGMDLSSLEFPLSVYAEEDDTGVVRGELGSDGGDWRAKECGGWEDGIGGTGDDCVRTYVDVRRVRREELLELRATFAAAPRDRRLHFYIRR